MVRCAAVADLLARDLSAPVDPDAVLTELTEFVATNHIKAAYERLFSALTAALKSPDEAVGIWISGPPGSGKSSFVRHLGYVLGDRDSYEVFLVNLRAELAVETHAGRAADTLENAEREHIIRVLRETRGVISGPNGAAHKLGLKRTTLQSKMQRLGITRKDY